MIRISLRNIFNSLINSKRSYFFSSSIEEPRQMNIRVNERVSKQQYRDYFKYLVPSIDKQCGEIIREMGKDVPDMKRLTKLLDHYLQFITGDSVQKSANGILTVLSAMHLSQLSTMNKYIKPLLEHTTRQCIQTAQIDSLNLNYYIHTEADYRSNLRQKMKNNRMLFNLMCLIQNNFEKVDSKLYPFIIQIICDEAKYQAHFLQVARKLQKISCQYMQAMLDKQKTEAKLFTDKFVLNLSDLFKIYGVEDLSQMEIFYRYIVQIYLFRSDTIKNKLFYLNSLYRNFNYDLKNQNGNYYKEMLLGKIVSRYLMTQRDISLYAMSKQGYYLCSSVLTHQFYQYAERFKYQIEGSLNYLPRSQLQSKPQLHRIFWEIYKLNPQSLNVISYFDHIIKDVYPERYIPTQGERITTIEPILETEMKVRMEQSLTGLGLRYQSETNVSSRFIDFLIEDDIILEVDGLHHFCLNSLQLTDKTQARNVHLLLKGYRMMMINIYEYNIAREKEDLMELIKCKLQLLKSKDAVLVF